VTVVQTIWLVQLRVEKIFNTLIKGILISCIWTIQIGAAMVFFWPIVADQESSTGSALGVPGTATL